MHGGVNINNKKIINILDQNSSNISELSKSISGINNNLKPLLDQIEKITKLCESLKEEKVFLQASKLYENINNTFNNVIKSINGSPLPKEEQEKVINLAIEYANLGMPYPINEQIDEFSSVAPIDEKYVDELCAKYSKGEDFLEIEKSIAELKYVSEQQIDESIASFKNQEYYACCSILFGIIDRELISSQEPRNSKRRKAYKKEIVKSNIETPQKINHWWRLFLEINTLYLFYYYYKTADDFIDESVKNYPVINRNFLMHGMTNRKITRNDCIKLFLFICNMKDEKERLL